MCILEFKGIVLPMCNDWKDLRGCIIGKRLANIRDLVAEEALYHDDYRKKIFTVLPASHSALWSRDDQVEQSMEKIIQWGGRHSVNGFVPTGTNATLALLNILKMIFCSFTKGCSAACGCRKVGIFCNNVCVRKGGCLNSGSVEDEDEDM